MSNKKFHGQDKRETVGNFFVYEIWENFMPDKLAGGEKLQYFPGILSEEQIRILIPFWKDLGVKLNDPILSLQLDKNGGTTTLYQYTDGRDEAPPNARCGIIKPIMEKGIKKMVLADSTRSTFVLHVSVNSSSLENDIRDFVSIIENNSLTEDELREKGAQEEVFSNTFVFDKRNNKTII